MGDRPTRASQHLTGLPVCEPAARPAARPPPALRGKCAGREGWISWSEPTGGSVHRSSDQGASARRQRARASLLVVVRGARPPALARPPRQHATECALRAFRLTCPKASSVI